MGDRVLTYWTPPPKCHLGMVLWAGDSMSSLTSISAFRRHFLTKDLLDSLQVVFPTLTIISDRKDELESKEEKSTLCPMLDAKLSLDGDQAWSRSALGLLVMCGFLTSCRKDFTTQVQVILRIHLLKLGTVEKRKWLKIEATGESLSGAALAFWEVQVTVTEVN